MIIVPDLPSCTFRILHKVTHAFLRADYALDIATYKHQLGHALFLSHASMAGNERGDPTDPMGYCEYCLFNGPHLLRLGWAFTIAVLNRGNFPAGRSTVFTVPAAVDARASVLQLYIDWDPYGRLDNLFVTYRVAKKQDIGLPNGFNETVLVHRQILATDDTTLLASLSTGQSYHNTQDKVVIAKVSGGSEQAQVQVCRYQSSVAECGTAGGGAAIVAATMVQVGDGADMVTQAAAAAVEAALEVKVATSNTHSEDVQPDYSSEDVRAFLDNLGKKGAGKGPVLTFSDELKAYAVRISSRGRAVEKDVQGVEQDSIAENAQG